MDIIISILYIVACVLLFALAILVHEFGHFIVALKLGLKVEAFSIGFGPVLWKKTVNGVEYRISALPLGGYVALPEVDQDGKEKAHAIPAWKEILVAVAGPFMNIVLAVVLAVLLSLIPSARFGTLPAVIGGVMEGGPAEKAGLKAGDKILAVSGVPINSWTDMQTEVQISGGKEIELQLEDRVVKLTPEKSEVTGAYYIKAISLTNETGSVAWMPERNPLKQLAWDAGAIFRVLKGLVTPKESKAVAGALGGPVMIAEGIYHSMRRSVWDGLGFLRFLNVNLAVLNLLPIPVLDGGLIFFALIALICRRRIPDVVVKYASIFFMVVLIALMGILILKDGYRSYKIHTYDASAESR